MQTAGYNIGNSSVPNGSEFIDLFIESRNVGTWAPGELEKVVQSGYVTPSCNEYLECRNIPQKRAQPKYRTHGHSLP
jgi:cobaltochelatase CobN